MTVIRKPVVPRYRIVADKLISNILSGRYPVNSALPSETEVAQLFAISRHTAREAMKIVEQAGLITRRRRAGSVVVTNELPTRYNQRIQSTNDLLNYSNSSRLKVIHATEIRMDEVLAERFRSKVGNECIQLKGIRYQLHDNRPFAFSEIYLRAARPAQRARLLDVDQAVTYLLKKIETSTLRVIEQTLIAENADKYVAQMLELPPAAATLKSVRNYIDNQGKLVMTACTWHAGNLFSYSTTLTKF